MRSCVPLFVRDLGVIWYKVRSCLTDFVRDLGRIWYKMRGRDDLPSSLKRSARRQFGALSSSRQKHCFCAAKT
ncbi:hypothetical protein HMPREF1580_01259 [Gardnerella vaginalis JCP8070]|nr:hypothetical protein HMPREF1580_01259 [Gardnerella vaginalis JCP8070]